MQHNWVGMAGSELGAMTDFHHRKGQDSAALLWGILEKQRGAPSS